LLRFLNGKDMGLVMPTRLYCGMDGSGDPPTPPPIPMIATLVVRSYLLNRDRSCCSKCDRRSCRWALWSWIDYTTKGW
jgi:hypothetical protein